jgi:hypothetical protein
MKIGGRSKLRVPERNEKTKTFQNQTMASSGTLLSDLDSNAGSSNDGDLVRKIFADMNAPGGGNPVISGVGQMISSPNPNTIAPMAMDSGPATSHLIGKDHPTPADFAAAMHGAHGASRMNEGNVPPPMPGNMAAQLMPPGAWNPYLNQQPQQMQQMPMDTGSKKNLYARIADEVKIPILVTILVFVFSLPFLNILFSHYIPSLLKPTGDVTHVGLLVKSVLAGATFWILQRVIAPLLSL